MTDEEFISYKDSRYKKALEYYDKRANTNRIAHRICSVYVLVVSIAITPILMFDQLLKGCGKVLAGVLAPSVAIVTGIAGHFKFLNNWLSYRATWDALQHELHRRNARILDYKDCIDRNALFVERVEALISKEGDEWLNRHVRKEGIGTLTMRKNL